MSFAKKIVTTYAKSLFQSLKEGLNSEKSEDYFNIGKITGVQANKVIPDIYLIGEELLLLRALILSSKSISQFFKNPTYSEEKKFATILSLFPGLTLSTQSFLKVLAERSHLLLIPEISEEYAQMIISFKNSTTVKIVTASGLKENYGLLLLNTLRNLTNSKEIILSAAYNPKLLGGLIIEYNSKSIDASILKEFSLFFNEI
jgi:F-type H+-transporting ATPase subunit delta